METTPPPPLLTGSQLRALREAAGLRQADLARALGLPRSAVWQMETGRCPIPRVRVEQILSICAQATVELTRLRAIRDALGDDT